MYVCMTVCIYIYMAPSSVSPPLMGWVGGWGGGREKLVLCGAVRFSQKKTYVAHKTVQKKHIFPYTSKGYALYCPFTWPAPSLWPSPPTPTDGSCSWHVLSSCIFSPYTHKSNSHLPYETPSCMYSLHSYVHPCISCSSLSLCHRSFLPVFLCIGTHITGELSSLYVSNYYPTTSYSFESVTISCSTMKEKNDLALTLLGSHLLHPCFSWGKIGTYLTPARARSIKTRTF